MKSLFVSMVFLVSSVAVYASGDDCPTCGVQLSGLPSIPTDISRFRSVINDRTFVRSLCNAARTVSDSINDVEDNPIFEFIRVSILGVGSPHNIATLNQVVKFWNEYQDRFICERDGERKHLLKILADTGKPNVIMNLFVKNDLIKQYRRSIDNYSEGEYEGAFPNFDVSGFSSTSDRQNLVQYLQEVIIPANDGGLGGNFQMIVNIMNVDSTVNQRRRTGKDETR